MKTLLKLTLISLLFTNCDPVSNMEANIENETSQTLVVDFISSNANERKTLNIKTNEIVIFQEGFDVGGSVLRPSFSEFDSIVIRNASQEILKIYKASDASKNIYNLENWQATEPEKRFYKYLYKIENTDIQ